MLCVPCVNRVPSACDFVILESEEYELNIRIIEIEFPQHPLVKEKPLPLVVVPQTIPESELNVALVRASKAEQNLAKSGLECEKLYKKVVGLSTLLKDM